MKIGLIGLGKMGYNLALNFVSKGVDVVAYDSKKKSSGDGIKVASSVADLCQSLTGQKIIWLMVPAGDAVDSVIKELTFHLQKDDVIIDGGNSHYKQTITRARELEAQGIHFLDCGTSGGVNGARQGVCTMVGGKKEVAERCEKIFTSISVDNGYLYCGKSGSGHFVKMVHNGIEYGMMQSIAEGLEVLHAYDDQVDLSAVTNLWNHGSVVRGWLMELAHNALTKDHNLQSIKGTMHSSGEGKWTVETALEMGVPAPVITMSLLMRYRSQTTDTFSGKVVAALRNEFGGHAVEKK
ncbi:MAG TPA: decarboxylating 6-phosphogluconate dehydrogenase [Cyclobacteriaceae bacterium]|jgi:6-phosphogluconate dehydrogenase|nr:decarboxylating 6-phosphogluconate dehydrogenase [Cyclobacteriaceae bacterium]